MNDVSTSGAKSKLYRTSDIYFAAFLCSIDFNLMTTEESRAGDGSRKVIFVFKMAPEHVKRSKTSFFGGSATVNAQKFVNNIRSLKSLCFV